MIQAGVVDYGSQLSMPVVMSSGEAEYILAVVVCMRTSLIRMLKYDLNFLNTKEYIDNKPIYEPATIMIDNETTISMTMCNKDTAGIRYVAQRYHYVRQGKALNELKFEWIGTKYQLEDTLTKPGTLTTFSSLWNL